MTQRLSWAARWAPWILLFGLAAGCSGADKDGSEADSEAEKEEFSPVPAVPGSGLAKGKHRLVEVGVTVRETKRNGNPWDQPAPEPDPRIEVWLAGKRVAACDTRDSHEATCELDKTITIDADTVIEFKVIDKDIAEHDRIGEARLAELTRHGTRDENLPMQTRGQLESAHFRLAGMPTWLDRYKMRIIGLLAGVFFGLLLWFAFERFWLRERADPDGEDADDGERDKPSSAGSADRAADTAPPEAKVYRVRCTSCGAMASSAHQNCEYCGQLLHEKPAEDQARK